MLRLILLTATLTLTLALPARAEFQLNIYTGSQSSPHSRVSGVHPDGGNYNGLIGWQGKSFQAPPYYGLRGTWWRNENSGFALEFTHAKVYAPAGERATLNFNRLEFTDGHNLITVNYMRRWQNRWNALTPYVGAGVGIALPHVDVTSAGGQKTYGYQLTGAAARAIAGVSYSINDRWDLFGEYQFTISQNKAKLTGGGTLDSRIITNAINFGLGFNF